MSIPVVQAHIRELVPTISEILVDEHSGGLCGRLYFSNLAKTFQDEKFQKSMAKVLQDVNAGGKERSMAMTTHHSLQSWLAGEWVRTRTTIH